MRSLNSIEAEIQTAARNRSALWAASSESAAFDISKLTLALVTLYEEKRFVAAGRVDVAAARARARIEEEVGRLANPRRAA